MTQVTDVNGSPSTTVVTSTVTRKGPWIGVDEGYLTQVVSSIATTISDTPTTVVTTITSTSSQGFSLATVAAAVDDLEVGDVAVQLDSDLAKEVTDLAQTVCGFPGTKRKRSCITEAEYASQASGSTGNFVGRLTLIGDSMQTLEIPAQAATVASLPLRFRPAAFFALICLSVLANGGALNHLVKVENKYLTNPAQPTVNPTVVSSTKAHTSTRCTQCLKCSKTLDPPSIVVAIQTGTFVYSSMVSSPVPTSSVLNIPGMNGLSQCAYQM